MARIYAGTYSGAAGTNILVAGAGINLGRRHRQAHRSGARGWGRRLQLSLHGQRFRQWKWRGRRGRRGSGCGRQAGQFRRHHRRPNARAALTVRADVDPSSSGIFDLTGNATLDIGELLGTKARVEFLGTSGDALTIGTPADFGVQTGSHYAAPLLEDFGAGDQIDLKNIGSSGLTLNDNSAGYGFQTLRSKAKKTFFCVNDTFMFSDLPRRVRHLNQIPVLCVANPQPVFRSRPIAEMRLDAAPGFS